MEQHAGKKRLVGEVAALLQDVMDGPVFVGGEGIQRMVGTLFCAPSGALSVQNPSRLQRRVLPLIMRFSLQNRSTLHKL